MRKKPKLTPLDQVLPKLTPEQQDQEIKEFLEKADRDIFHKHWWSNSHVRWGEVLVGSTIIPTTPYVQKIRLDEQRARGVDVPVVNSLQELSDSPRTHRIGVAVLSAIRNVFGMDNTSN